MSNLFHSYVSQIKLFTIVSEDRLRTIYHLSQLCNDLEGDVAELGVYRGGISMLLRMLTPTSKKVLAFDSYEGIPNWNNTIDKVAHKNGDFAIEDKHETLDRLTSLSITPVVGMFKDTCIQFTNTKFCFAHFDGDSYQSCKEFLEFFWPRLSNHGILVFDDLDWSNTPGVRKAIDMWLRDTPDAYVFKTSQYQGMIVKN